MVLPEQGNRAGKAFYWDAISTLWRTELDIYRDSLSFSPFSHVPHRLHIALTSLQLQPKGAEMELLKLSAQPGKFLSVETGWRNSPGFQVSIEL